MDTSSITSRIDTALKERGISKQEFYEACGISSAAYSQWNTGKTTPRVKRLKVIADYLQIHVEYLITGIGPKEKKPLINGDEELTEYLDELRSRPEKRMLFSVTKNATKAQIEAIVKMIEEMKGD